MKLPAVSDGQAQIIIGIVGVAIAGYALYQAKGAISNAAGAVNPFNNDNVFNKGVNSLVGLDNKSASIGTKIYDFFHPNEGFKPTPEQVIAPKKTVLATIKSPSGTVGVLKPAVNAAKIKQQGIDNFWSGLGL